MQTQITPYVMMTAALKRLVRDSFESLREYAPPLGLLFYGKLFELDPNSRKLFHVDLAEQVRKLMDMLASVVESLDDLEPLRARLAELGRKHAEYGVRPEQYDTLATALLWAFSQSLGADFDAPTREAWQLAIDAISTAMKAGVK